jgi:hypothetical protein
MRAAHSSYDRLAGETTVDIYAYRFYSRSVMPVGTSQIQIYSIQ